MAHTPSPNNLSTCYQRISLNELAKLFNAADSAVVHMILQQLCHIQTKAGVQHRFHLILESQVNTVPHASNPRSCSMFQPSSNLSTRILFSPTLSPSATCGFECSRLDTLIRSLNEISYHAMPANQFPSAQQISSHHTRQATHSSAPFLATQKPTPLSQEEEELRHVGTFHIPTWFPFLGTEYTKPPQLSDEKLVIDPAIATKFSALSNEDISLLYRVLFEFLHRHARKKTQKYKQSMLKYSMFTPPWLRRQFIVGRVVVLMPKVVLPDQRENRNKMGYRRMALILAGFYANEPYFGKFVLEYLLGRLPDIKREAERRRQVRHAPLTSFAQTRVEKRMRSPQKFTRQVKIRHPSAQQADAGRPQQNMGQAGTETRARSRTERQNESDNRTEALSGDNNPSSLPDSSDPSDIPAPITARVEQSSRGFPSQRKQVPKSGRGRIFSGKHSSRSPEGGKGSSNLEVSAVSPAFSGDPGEGSEEDGNALVADVPKTQDAAKVPEVACGAGTNCIFVKDANCQDVDSITGKCSKCDHPLHDLCGGGEEGAMLCISCAQ